MATQQRKGKKTLGPSRKDNRRLPLYNAAVHPGLSEPSDEGPIVARVFNVKQPRSRSENENQEAVPTWVVIYPYGRGKFEAEPLDLRQNPVGEIVPELYTLEQTSITEIQRYELTLMMTPSVWAERAGFWPKCFNVSDESMFEYRINFYQAFDAGDDDAASEIARKTAMALLHIKTPESLPDGFWEMNDLIDEPQRPARMFLEDSISDDVYILRLPVEGEDASRNMDLSGFQLEPESTTPSSTEMNHSSTSVSTETQCSRGRFGRAPNTEEIMFLARFPVPKEAASRHRPPLTTNSKVRQHQSESEPTQTNVDESSGNLSAAKKKKKIKGKKKSGRQKALEATTATSEETFKSGPQVDIGIPQPDLYEGEPGPAEVFLTTDISRTDSRSAFDTTSHVPATELESESKTKTYGLASDTATSRSSSQRPKSLYSSPQIATTPATEDESGLGKPPRHSVQAGEGFSAAVSDYYAARLNYDTLFDRFLSGATETTETSVSNDAPEFSKESEKEKPRDPIRGTQNVYRTNEKEGDVVFVYQTWKGLSEARRGARELADTFGEECLEKGIVLYAIDEKWQLASLH